MSDPTKISPTAAPLTRADGIRLVKFIQENVPSHAHAHAEFHSAADELRIALGDEEHATHVLLRDYARAKQYGAVDGNTADQTEEWNDKAEAAEYAIADHAGATEAFIERYGRKPNARPAKEDK